MPVLLGGELGGELTWHTSDATETGHDRTASWDRLLRDDELSSFSCMEAYALGLTQHAPVQNFHFGGVLVASDSIQDGLSPVRESSLAH